MDDPGGVNAFRAKIARLPTTIPLALPGHTLARLVSQTYTPPSELNLSVFHMYTYV
jgi:hypothetical protein